MNCWGMLVWVAEGCVVSYGFCPNMLAELGVRAPPELNMPNVMAAECSGASLESSGDALEFEEKVCPLYDGRLLRSLTSWSRIMVSMAVNTPVALRASKLSSFQLSHMRSDCSSAASLLARVLPSNGSDG